MACGRGRTTSSASARRTAWARAPGPSLPRSTSPTSTCQSIWASPSSCARAWRRGPSRSAGARRWPPSRARRSSIFASSAQVEKDADVSQSTGPASRGRAPKIDGALQSAADDDDGDAAAQRARRGRRATKQAHRRHALLDAAKKTKVAPTATGGVLMGMTFEGLQPGLDYRFRVAAVSSIGQGPFSASTSNTRASSDRPARPLAPNCVALSKTSVRVTWCAPMEHGASVKRYELQRLDEPDAPPQEFSRFHATMDFVDLLAGRKYSFAVRAFNVIGASEWSEASEPTTTLTDIAETPQRPDIVSTAITTVDLAVEKPDNSGRVVSALLVQRRELRTGGVRSEWANEQSFAPPPGGAGVRCPMRLEPLLPDTVYQFRCAAVNAHGTSPWSLPTFRARTLPAELPWAPGVPVPGDRFPGAVELAWAAAEPRGAKVVGHVLQSKRLRRTSVLPEAPPEAQAAEHGAPAPAAVDDAGSLQGILTESEIGSRPNFRAEALEKSAKYVVRIAAVNSVGQGPFSPWSSVFACLQTD
ncbi:fibronectin type III [Pelagophyceae sp. CCMP2097]|nr:fibronectin type III [Pelagophyceae sp. CCMP2097]